MNQCRARVASVRALGPDVLEAVLAMDDPPDLHFQAGQWVSVPFGPKTVRAYSIASSPRARETISLVADVAPGGLGSRWFRGLAPGDEVRFKGPLGGFVLLPSETREAIFVAEEIGIVPIRSILVDLAECGLTRGARLVAWAREPQALLWDREFRALARSHPSFAYHPVVGAADPGWTGAVGRLEDQVDRLTPSVENVVAYVAGGEQAIHRVRDRLMDRGLQRKAVRWEKFW